MIKIIAGVIILTWGISTLTLFHQNIDDFDECGKNTLNYDFKMLMYFAVYSTFISSLFFVLDLFKKNKNDYWAKIASLILTINLLSGIIIFMGIIYPFSYLYSCSKETILVAILCCLIVEFFFLTLCVLAVGLFIYLTYMIFVIVKNEVIKPFKHISIKHISFIGLVVWDSTLLWSFIVFEKNNTIFLIGVFQIIFSIASLYVLKKYYAKLKYSLFIVVVFSLVVYFLEVFKSPLGLTPYGIVSFTSIGFFPAYFAMKKTKKVYKKFLSNRTLRHQEMPKEPPAICASGEYTIYK